MRCVEPAAIFFGQDGCYHLALGVQVECAFDSDQDVVGGAEPYRAAPDDASSFSFDDAMNVRNGQVPAPLFPWYRPCQPAK